MLLLCQTSEVVARQGERGTAPDDEVEVAAPDIDDSQRYDHHIFCFKYSYILLTFSNTRHISEVSSGDEVSGLPPRGLTAAFLKSRLPEAKKRPRATKTVRLKCPSCKKGFQFGRNPPLQLKCQKCPVYVHLRCIEDIYDEENFICRQCSSSIQVNVAVESNQAVSNQEEVPANTECSLDELANTTVPMAEKLAVSTFPECRFTERMRFLGFERSRTQPNTPGDGSCFIWAVLDGYNNNQNYYNQDSMFPRHDAMFLRYKIIDPQ